MVEKIPTVEELRARVRKLPGLGIDWQKHRQVMLDAEKPCPKCRRVILCGVDKLCDEKECPNK